MAWNRPNESSRSPVLPQRGSRPALGGIVAAAIVAICAGIAAWLILPDAERGADATSAGRKRIVEKAPAEAQEPAPKAAGREPLPLPKLSCGRVETREAISAPQPLDEMKQEVRKLTKARGPFTNGVEQLIALATPPYPGATVPPLPPITDESVAKSLKEAMSHEIMAEEGDTEAMLEKKAVVTSAKIEFSELRDREGYGFTEYVNALRDKANADAEFMSEAHRLADEIYHDAGVSDDDYVKYREELNEKLRERGLPEIEKEEGEK